MKVYGDIRSGNCYKLKLLLGQLGLPFDWVHVDILAGETRTPQFLAMNPNGRIPVLETDTGCHLAESNAILWYLAEGTPLLPMDRLHRAQVLQWMFFEQYSHEPNIATSRYIIQYLGRPAGEEARLQQKVAPGYHALDVMETHLADRQFFVAERYSSPTSRCTPTRTWPARAASTWRATRRSAAGSSGWPASRATAACSCRTLPRAPRRASSPRAPRCWR